MSNFRDEVMSCIPNEEKMEIDEIALIKKDALRIASIIRKRILEVAKQYTSQQPFVYEGILFENTFFIEQKSNIAKKQGLFGNITEYKYVYSLKQNAHTFYSELRKELENDDIKISKWQLFEFSVANDDFMDDLKLGSYLKDKKCCFYLYDKWKKVDFRIIKGPYLFDETLNVIRKDKFSVISGAESSYAKSFYKDQIFNTFFNPYACISIEFWVYMKKN